MNFLILDVYPNDSWRLVKDTAGGYGTGNDFGTSFFSSLLSRFTAKMIAMPPMHALYVSSILKNKGARVDYARKINIEEVNRADYVVLPTSIISHETEINILNQLEKLNKKIFVTGIFGNVVKKNYQRLNTYVVSGEPENFFLRLKLDANILDEFFLQNSDSSKVINGMVENLDDLPFPDWEDYSKKYPLRNNFVGFNSRIAIPILASRGCPYSCFNYCTYPLQQGRKVRLRSIENVITEIKYWIKTLKTNKFIFRDPVFSINRKFTKNLCEAIIKNNLKLEYLIETHLKNLDEELIQLLKQSGLKVVYVGIESFNEKVLNNIQRFTIKNDEQYKLINNLKKQGIIVKSMFMLGNPEDDIETMRKSVNYARRLPNQLAQFSIFTPYPGTPVFKDFQNNIIVKKYERFNQYNLVYKHKYLNNQDLINMKNYAYRKFYLDYRKISIICKSALSLFRN